MEKVEFYQSAILDILIEAGRPITRAELAKRFLNRTDCLLGLRAIPLLREGLIKIKKEETVKKGLFGTKTIVEEYLYID